MLKDRDIYSERFLNRKTIPETINKSKLFRGWKGIDKIIHQGLYRDFNMYTYRDTDDNSLLAMCPELNIFMNEIDGEYNDSEDIILEELEELIDWNIKVHKELGAEKNWSLFLRKYVYF